MLRVLFSAIEGLDYNGVQGWDSLPDYLQGYLKEIGHEVEAGHVIVPVHGPRGVCAADAPNSCPESYLH